MPETTLKDAAAVFANKFQEAREMGGEITKALGLLNSAIDKARRAGLQVDCSYGSVTAIDYMGKETKLPASFHVYVSVLL